MDVLGRGLMSAERLTRLAITRSDLTAVKFRRLLPYLDKCCGLEAIDFSHCRLNSSGAEFVARYAKTAKNLKSVNLRGNDIDADGVQSLAYASWRRRNSACPAIELNLSTCGHLGAIRSLAPENTCSPPPKKFSSSYANPVRPGSVRIVYHLSGVSRIFFRVAGWPVENVIYFWKRNYKGLSLQAVHSNLLKMCTIRMYQPKNLKTKYLIVVSLKCCFNGDVYNIMLIYNKI